MQELAGEDARIVRVMPNTPCLVGETASAMCLGGKATEEDAETVRALFGAVGSIVQVQRSASGLASLSPTLSGLAPHCLHLDDPCCSASAALGMLLRCTCSRQPCMLRHGSLLIEGSRL